MCLRVVEEPVIVPRGHYPYTGTAECRFVPAGISDESYAWLALKYLERTLPIIAEGAKTCQK